MTNKEYEISFRLVNKKFPKMDRKVLDDFNLNCIKGSINIIIGYSGMGKSVCLKHALGILQPDSGEVKVRDKLVNQCSAVELQELRKSFGMLFQHAALFDSLTVFENVAFPLREYKKNWSEEQVSDRVHELLDTVELVNVDSKMPSEISGGMAKRVGLARAIAMEPKILLFDEPTTGLDPVTSQVIHNLIVKTTKNLEATALIISHDVHAALDIADYVSMLHMGKVIECSKPEEFVQSQNGIIRQFLHCAGIGSK